MAAAAIAAAVVDIVAAAMNARRAKKSLQLSGAEERPRMVPGA
jgi:hypothetical protein